MREGGASGGSAVRGYHIYVADGRIGGLKRNIGVLYLIMEWVGEMVRYLLIQRTLRKAKQKQMERSESQS